LCHGTNNSFFPPPSRPRYIAMMIASGSFFYRGQGISDEGASPFLLRHARGGFLFSFFLFPPFFPMIGSTAACQFPFFFFFLFSPPKKGHHRKNSLVPSLIEADFFSPLAARRLHPDSSALFLFFLATKKVKRLPPSFFFSRRVRSGVSRPPPFPCEPGVALLPVARVDRAPPPPFFFLFPLLSGQTGLGSPPCHCSRSPHTSLFFFPRTKGRRGPADCLLVAISEWDVLKNLLFFLAGKVKSGPPW